MNDKVKKAARLILTLFLLFIAVVVVAILVALNRGGDKNEPEITHTERFRYEYVTEDGQRRPTFKVTVDYYDDGTARLESFGAEITQGGKKVKMIGHFDIEEKIGFYEATSDDRNRDFHCKASYSIKKDAFGTYEMQIQKTEGQGTDRLIVAYLKPL